MNINDSHLYIDDILKKTQSGAVNSIIKDRMLERAQMSEFATKKALFIETGEIHASLAPFVSEFNFTSNANGIITCPPDYLYPTGSYSVSWNNGLQKIAYGDLPVLLKDELAGRLTSQLLPVDTNNGILYISGKKQITGLPKGVFDGTIHYLRKPLRPVFNFILSTSGRRQIYNPTGSVDLEWEDDYVNVILDKAIEMLGVNLNSPGTTQWAAAKAANNLGGNKA